MFYCATNVLTFKYDFIHLKFITDQMWNSITKHVNIQKFSNQNVQSRTYITVKISVQCENPAVDVYFK